MSMGLTAAVLGVMVSLQMVAELVGEGVLTGTIDMSNDVEFQISADVFVKKNGESEVSVSSNQVRHEAGFGGNSWAMFPSHFV